MIIDLNDVRFSEQRAHTHTFYRLSYNDGGARWYVTATEFPAAYGGELYATVKRSDRIGHAAVVRDMTCSAGRRPAGWHKSKVVALAQLLADAADDCTGECGVY